MKYIALGFLCCSVVGCATVGSLERGSGSKFIVKNVEYEKLWKAANRVVSQQLTIVQTSRDNGVIKAEKGAGLATWGEVVGVFITKSESASGEYTVEVQSLKRSRMQLTGQNWEQTIIQGMK